MPSLVLPRGGGGREQPLVVYRGKRRSIRKRYLARFEVMKGAFAGPALSAITPAGTAQIVDIASAPFVRPDPEPILRGIALARDRGHPPRGTAD